MKKGTLSHIRSHLELHKLGANTMQGSALLEWHWSHGICSTDATAHL